MFLHSERGHKRERGSGVGVEAGEPDIDVPRERLEAPAGAACRVHRGPVVREHELAEAQRDRARGRGGGAVIVRQGLLGDVGCVDGRSGQHRPEESPDGADRQVHRAGRPLQAGSDGAGGAVDRRLREPKDALGVAEDRGARLADAAEDRGDKRPDEGQDGRGERAIGVHDIIPCGRHRGAVSEFKRVRMQENRAVHRSSYK